MTCKLYLIVRGDLPPGQQAVQAAHALRQFVYEHPETDRVWFEQSNTLALLASSNEAHLGVIAEEAHRRRIPVACFREPDRNNELTAIAIGPQGKNLTRNLPLALQWLSLSSSPSRSSSASSGSSS
jgi:peptidyl-tRNA hydrolase